MSNYDVDVLVVGAGPVGLVAALQLARWNVSVRLVDAAPGPATTSRALGTHARSLEIYDQLGILGDIAPYGTRVNAFVRHQNDGTTRADYDFGALATRFPYMFNVDQVITERVLRGHAAAAGVDVEWHTRLDGFEQDDTGVTATLTVGDDIGSEAGGDPESGRETVRARYLWGCDGGRSTVRKTLELPLVGEAAHTWLIADATVQTDVARDALHWLFPPGGTLMLFPFPDPHKWRLLDTTGEGDADDPDRIAAQFSTKLSQALGHETVVSTPSWVSKFTIQQRAVPTMHVGRCFVSGDAAHVHSPASGQGLNTGIQDAYNLAWKLAMVVHDDADTTLLDSYDAERVPIGQALLASTGEVMGTAMADSAPTGAVTAAETQATDTAFARKLIRTMSGLMIGYCDSPLTVSSPATSAGPQPGQRLTQVSAAEAASVGWVELRDCLRAPAWHLLVFAGDAPSPSSVETGKAPAWLQRVSIGPGAGEGRDVSVRDPDGVLEATLAATAGDWILVRPDGYVSARGTGAAGLQDAFDRLTSLHLRGAVSA